MRAIYHMLLAFFQGKEAQNTMRDLEDKMEIIQNGKEVQDTPEYKSDAESYHEDNPSDSTTTVGSTSIDSTPDSIPDQGETPYGDPLQPKFPAPRPPSPELVPRSPSPRSQSASPTRTAPPTRSNAHRFKVHRKPVNHLQESAPLGVVSLPPSMEKLALSREAPASSPHLPLQTSSPQHEHARLSTSELRLPITNVINSETLDKYMRTFPEKILIIDVRRREQFDAGRFPSQNVVCIEPFFLKANSNEFQLREALTVNPNQEKHLFEIRDQFELVVFHDWNTMSLGRDPQTPAQQCLQHLVDIIYNNAFRKILQRAPCLLVGGLEAWVEFTGDTLWKRQVRPLPPPPPVDFKTPKPPRSIPSRDGSRKGSVVSIESPNAMDGSIGAKHGYTRDDYIKAQASPSQAFQLDRGIVRPTYSHISTASIPATSGVVAPPAMAAFQGNGQEARAYQRMSMPSLPTMSDYRDQRFFPKQSTTFNGNMPANPPPGQAAPIPRQIMAPSAGPNQFYEFATGLVNLGNTCYMNCILQCLVGTSRLSEMFLNGDYQVQLDSRLGHQGHLAHVYARLVRTMYQASLHAPRGQLAYIAPKDLKYLCGKLSESFSGYEQQDCHEFLNFMLDGLHEDLNLRGNKPPLKALTEREEAKREAMNVHEASLNEWMRHLFNNESPISRHIQGQYLSRLECRCCGCTSTTYNPFSCLSIPIPHGGQVTLQDCFKQFTHPELLDGDDAWNCPKCKKRQPTIKTMRISRLPDFLIIHLKRFKHAGGIWGSNKLGTYVRYPASEELDLLPFWLPTNGLQQLSNSSSRPYQSPPFRYRLYGVANHYGTLKGGHYTAYVKRGRMYGWCQFDDTKVRIKVSEEEVVNKNAYVLFYQRV